jgi:hypothetical protein
MTARNTLDTLGFDTSEINPTMGDPFGFAMGAMFDLAHALEHYGRDYAPAHWHYSDSPICHGLEKHMSGEDEQARRVAAYIARHPEREREIIHAGNVLDRYIRVLERSGRSY